jgi:hypothetical protein
MAVVSDALRQYASVPGFGEPPLQSAVKFDVVNVPGDGACLFHSFASIVGEDHNAVKAKLRARAVSDHVSNSDVQSKQQMETLYDVKSYNGGEPEIAAFAEVYGLRVTAFVRASSKPDTVNERVYVAPKVFRANAQRAVFIVNTGAHYQPLFCEWKDAKTSAPVKRFQFDCAQASAVCINMQIAAQVHLFPWVGGCSRRSLPFIPKNSVRVLTAHSAASTPALTAAGSAKPAAAADEGVWQKKKPKPKAKSKNGKKTSMKQSGQSSGHHSQVLRPVSVHACVVYTESKTTHTGAAVSGWLHARAPTLTAGLITVLPVRALGNRSKQFYALFQSWEECRALFERGTFQAVNGGGPNITVGRYYRLADVDSLVAKYRAQHCAGASESAPPPPPPSSPGSTVVSPARSYKQVLLRGRATQPHMQPTANPASTAHSDAASTLEQRLIDAVIARILPAVNAAVPSASAPISLPPPTAPSVIVPASVSPTAKPNAVQLLMQLMAAINP